MAFTKKTWQCEETITADDLNRLEDGVEQALECCGGGSADVGYSCDAEELFAGTYNLEEGDEFARFGELPFVPNVIRWSIDEEHNGISFGVRDLSSNDMVYQLFKEGTHILLCILRVSLFGKQVSISNCIRPLLGEHQISIYGINVEASECFDAAVYEAMGGRSVGSEVLIMNMIPPQDATVAIPSQIDTTCSDLKTRMLRSNVVLTNVDKTVIYSVVAVTNSSAFIGSTDGKIYAYEEKQVAQPFPRTVLAYPVEIPK